MRFGMPRRFAANCAAMFVTAILRRYKQRAGTTSTPRTVRPVTRSKNGGRSRPFAVPGLTRSPSQNAWIRAA